MRYIRQQHFIDLPAPFALVKSKLKRKYYLQYFITGTPYFAAESYQSIGIGSIDYNLTEGTSA